MHIIKHFNCCIFYIFALLFNQDNKLKQTGISKLFNKSTKFIRSFLNKTVDFDNLFLKLIRILNIDLSQGYFSIDDTSYSKPYTRKLNNLSILFDHRSKGYTKGFVVVFICWSNDTITLPIAFQIWHKNTGKTKIDIALELIKYARKISNEKNNGFRMDSFYAAKKILAFLHKNHIFFATRLPKSRTVFVGSKQTKLKSIRFARRSMNVWMPVVGRVWITKYKGKYYCSNRCPDYQKQMYKWYAQRWCVECVFRFVKSELKMEDCQGVNSVQHVNHIGYCFLVHGLLQGAFPELNPYEAKRKIESMYITKSITIKQEVLQLCA